MTTTDTRPDTHDMVVVHRVFRREATLLPRLVAAVRPGDVARARLLEHLEDEEEQLLPVAEAYLSAAEWARLGERFAEQTPLPLQMLFLGAILEEATAAERSTLLGNLPAPARLVWRLAGRPWYAWHIGRIRSTMDSR